MARTRSWAKRTRRGVHKKRAAARFDITVARNLIAIAADAIRGVFEEAHHKPDMRRRIALASIAATSGRVRLREGILTIRLGRSWTSELESWMSLHGAMVPGRRPGTVTHPILSRQWYDPGLGTILRTPGLYKWHHNIFDSHRGPRFNEGMCRIAAAVMQLRDLRGRTGVTALVNSLVADKAGNMDVTWSDDPLA